MFQIFTINKTRFSLILVQNFYYFEKGDKKVGEQEDSTTNSSLLVKKPEENKVLSFLKSKKLWFAIIDVTKAIVITLITSAVG